jgi:16S rRNA pseudouridine516 synthase
LTPNDREKLTNWITLDDWYLTQPAQIETIDSITTKLTIHEGKFHQVKRMREAIDNQVLLLHRESIGSYDLKNLQIPEEKRQYIK